MTIWNGLQRPVEPYVALQLEPDESTAGQQRLFIGQTDGKYGWSLFFDGYFVPFIHPYPAEGQEKVWNLEIIGPYDSRFGGTILGMTEEELEKSLPLALNLMAISHGVQGFGKYAEHNVFNNQQLTFPYQTLKISETTEAVTE